MNKKIFEEIERFSELSGTKINLNESSLSRVWRHSEEHDIAIITAFRTEKKDCLENSYQDEFPIGHKYKKIENLERNKILSAYLLQKGYAMTKVDGTYVMEFQTPAAKESKENSYFVVNRHDDENFLDNLINVSKYFCQDSVLLKPKGEDAFLYGTNNNSFPGLDLKHELGSFKGGEDAEFMTKVKDRPFYFGKYNVMDVKETFNNGAKFIISELAKKVKI